MPKGVGYKDKKKPKRRLKNFDFSDSEAHIALVDVAANGTEVLLTKRFGDARKYDPETGELVELEESGLRVNMSLEDVMMFFTNLFPEDIETLTSAITKAANGEELEKSLKVHLVDNPDTLALDVFKARVEKFRDRLDALEENEMEALRYGAAIVKQLIDNGDVPRSVLENVEKSEMPKDNENDKTELEKGAQTPEAPAKAEVPESVQKALDDKDETIRKQADRLERLEKAEDARVTAEFVAKAKDLEPLGLPAVAENEDAAESFGLALKALSAADADAYAKVESVLLKAADTIKKAENLEEIGADGQPDLDDNASKLEKAAAKLKEEDPSLSNEAAIAKALEANPSLYE